MIVPFSSTILPSSWNSVAPDRSADAVEAETEKRLGRRENLQRHRRPSAASRQLHAAATMDEANNGAAAVVMDARARVVGTRVKSYLHVDQVTRFHAADVDAAIAAAFAALAGWFDDTRDGRRLPAASWR